MIFRPKHAFGPLSFIRICHSIHFISLEIEQSEQFALVAQTPLPRPHPLDGIAKIIKGALNQWQMLCKDQHLARKKNVFRNHEFYPPGQPPALKLNRMRIRIDQFNELHLIGALQWMIHDFIDQDLACRANGWGFDLWLNEHLDLA